MPHSRMSWRHINREYKNGFTLIEFIMVIILVCIMAGMSSKLVYQGFNSFLTSSNATDANWQGQVAMERMAREIRSARASSDVNTASTVTFTFIDTSGNNVSCTLSGSTVKIILNGTSYTLADGVNSLTFAYYDANGNITPVLANIRYVTISLNIAKNGSNYTMNTGIFLRNLY